MSPTPRAAGALAAAGLAAFFLGPLIGALAALALLGLLLVDAFAVREPPEVERRLPALLARGVPADLVVQTGQRPGPVRIRQPLPPDLRASGQDAEGRLEAKLVARRRGRHLVAPAVTRSHGPLGLGRWDHQPGDGAEVRVYPDFVAARRLALAVRHGRLREAGRLVRGPLGLGTDFESVREYLPDDDVRQINWLATQRAGRPMSNQFRVEQDREVILLVDAGRLMAAPIGDATRLDVTVDAATAVAMVADELGDRVGVVAFDRTVRRRVNPRRAGGRFVIEALFDLEPSSEEPDYELAFRAVEGGKRALVVVLCDLLEEAAAQPLLDAMAVLTRTHAVIVASPADDDLRARLLEPPADLHGVAGTVVALDVLRARRRVVHMLQATGAQVLEAPAGALGAACVSAYLRAKARARL
jgi:uncharacterized protein (DUF58 family)